MALNPLLLPPNTVLLSGRDECTIINDLPIIDTGALPGHFVELFFDSGSSRLAWRKVSSAVNVPSKHILLEESYRNNTLSTPYTSGTPAMVAVLDAGMTVWALVPSGQNITAGDALQQNGDGNLKEASAVTAAANVWHYSAMETLGAVTVLTRCRTAVMQ